MKNNTLVPECEALAFARQFIADERATGSFDNWGVSVFDKDGGTVLISRLINMLINGDLRHALVVIDWARDGFWLADTAIRNVCDEHIRHGLPIPPLLTEYYLAKPVSRPRGGDKTKNILSDLFLVTLVMTLCERFGLKETRSAYSRRKESACSVASRAATESGLHRGGESALNKIVKRYLPAVRWLTLDRA